MNHHLQFSRQFSYGMIFLHMLFLFQFLLCIGLTISYILSGKCLLFLLHVLPYFLLRLSIDSYLPVYLLHRFPILFFKLNICSPFYVNCGGTNFMLLEVLSPYNFVLKRARNTYYSYRIEGINGSLYHEQIFYSDNFHVK